jgi:hypothetical protein
MGKGKLCVFSGYCPGSPPKLMRKFINYFRITGDATEIVSHADSELICSVTWPSRKEATKDSYHSCIRLQAVPWSCSFLHAYSRIVPRLGHDHFIRVHYCYVSGSFAWLMVMGSGFDDWVYWHFCTIIINYDSLQSMTAYYSLYSLLDDESLLFHCDELRITAHALSCLERRLSDESLSRVSDFGLNL